MTILLVIAILVFLIVAHEFGHFIAAKFFKVRVEEFGVGYPPRALSLGKIGETEYTLNWIPFGGFVRLFGEDDGSPNRGPGSFIDAQPWKQAVILVAGVVMNALAAWLLFTGAYAIGILHPVETYVPGARLIITDVVPGSPADVANISVGDYVLAVSDTDGDTLDQPTPESVVEFVSERAGEEITMLYEHDMATSTAILRPAHGVVPDQSGRPAIGLGLVLVTTESEPLGKAMMDGYRQAEATLRLSTVGLGQILGGLVHGAPNLEDVTGPVGLVSYVSEASNSGWGYVLSLAGFISINLAVINMIPIPALDGGRLLIVLGEMVFRRTMPRLGLQLLNTIGVALIIMLMVAVTYQDIARLLA